MLILVEKENDLKEMFILHLNTQRDADKRIPKNGK